MTDHAARMLKHLSEQLDTESDRRRRLASAIAALQGLVDGLMYERMPVTASEVAKIVELLKPLLGGEK